jgi:hypothetical protein
VETSLVSTTTAVTGREYNQILPFISESDEDMEGIRKDILLLALGTAIGTILTALSVLHGNDTILWTTLLWVGVCMTLFTLTLILARNTSTRYRAVLIAIELTAIVIISGWYYWPKNSSLPGFGAYAVIRLYDTPEYRRRYVFDFASDNGSKASFYLSAASRFTFAITDEHGETYPLEIRVGGADGLPIDSFIILFLDAGNDGQSMQLRALVNGREVAQRTFPIAVNLGDRDWKAGSLGAPTIGKNQGGLFLLQEIGAYPSTFTDKAIAKLIDNVRGFYNYPFK